MQRPPLGPPSSNTRRGGGAAAGTDPAPSKPTTSEEYLRQHGVREMLGDIISELIAARPVDALTFVANALTARESGSGGDAVAEAARRLLRCAEGGAEPAAADEALGEVRRWKLWRGGPWRVA